MIDEDTVNLDRSGKIVFSLPYSLALAVTVPFSSNYQSQLIFSVPHYPSPFFLFSPTLVPFSKSRKIWPWVELKSLTIGSVKNSESDRTPPNLPVFFVHNVCWVWDSVDTWWDCSGIRYNFESLNQSSMESLSDESLCFTTRNRTKFLSSSCQTFHLRPRVKMV